MAIFLKIVSGVYLVFVWLVFIVMMKVPPAVSNVLNVGDQARQLGSSRMHPLSAFSTIALAPHRWWGFNISGRID